MTLDLASLARDLDRLFRARQDGRQMPVDERFESADGLVSRSCEEEWHAFAIGMMVDVWDGKDAEWICAT